jgi:hypothetical protein
MPDIVAEVIIAARLPPRYLGTVLTLRFLGSVSIKKDEQLTLV